MYGYLIQNIPAEQNIYFCLEKNRNLEIVFNFHNKFISLIQVRQMEFKWCKILLSERSYYIQKFLFKF